MTAKRKTNEERLYEKPLPANFEAERAVLGAILLDNALCSQARDWLRPREFLSTANREIYTAQLALHERSRPIDIVTLSDELKRADKFAVVGGAGYIASLIDGLPRLGNLKYYAQIIKAKALLRRIITTSENAITHALDEQVSGQELLRGREGSTGLIERLGILATEYEEVNSLEDAARIGLRPPLEYVDDVAARFARVRQREMPPGSFRLGVDPDIEFHRGETTAWVGFTNHGKTTFLYQAILDAIGQGEKVVLAGLEKHPADSYWVLTRQASGERNPTRELQERILRALTNRLWIFNLVGTQKRQRLFDVLRIAHEVYGATQCFIDCLGKISDISSDDWAGQARFVNDLGDFAVDKDVHAHLVHHVRNKDQGTEVPFLGDIKGAGEISNLMTNVLIVHRNTLSPEERDRRRRKNLDRDYEYDMTFRYAKGKLPEIPCPRDVHLYYDWAAMISKTSPDASPYYYRDRLLELEDSESRDLGDHLWQRF